MSFDLSSFTVAKWLESLVDVAIVAYVIYVILKFVRGTRAVQLLRGVIVIVIVATAAQWLQLNATSWLFKNFELALVVGLPIVFQPELRRALEQLGRGRFFQVQFADLGGEAVTSLIDELLRAAAVLSRNKIGALIVLERETGLADIVETGIRVDAVVTAELLINIFIPNTPLHDGAVIVRGNRILAAACFLPLAETQLGTEFGSRHRAAVGISEHSDALALVVSEETGAISLASAAKLIRSPDEHTLREMLEQMLPPKEVTSQLHLRPRGGGARQHG
jgi:diadenylate cyclase